MKGNYWTLSVAMLMLSVFAACIPRSSDCCPDPSKTVSGAVLQGQTNESRQGCVLPPQPFKDSDVVGTWVAQTVTFTDTIILREDYTYTQMYSNRATGDKFEIQAQKWWIEYRGIGRPYLHLEGMHKCDDLNQCRQQGGGGGNRLWYDFCEGRVIKMPDEVILIVLGLPEGRKSKAKWTIELYHLMPDPDSSPTYFVPQQ